jgi:redox-sensitive bicupin YhaK (pirin superfamily)
MSAGTGVKHSEFNPSSGEPLHLFQIWIEPATRGTQASYEQIRFDPEEKKNMLKRLAGPGGANGAARRGSIRTRTCLWLNWRKAQRSLILWTRNAPRGCT